MSWSEVQRALADEPRSDDSLPTALKLMTEERSKFLANKERTTLRVACWPVPLDRDRVDLQRDGKEIGQALWDASVVGVRSSGWNFLSSAQPKVLQSAVEGGQAEPAAYRHVRIARDGRVEFETDRDELWSWHAQAMGDAVIDPFVLLEYPVSVLHLARWLLARNETIAPPSRILVDLSIRNVRGVQLGAGSPASVIHGMRGWGRLGEDVDALCIRETGPVDVSGDEFMANPDRVAFRLASEAYRAFGWEAKDIPFYDAATERFVFPR